MDQLLCYQFSILNSRVRHGSERGRHWICMALVGGRDLFLRCKWVYSATPETRAFPRLSSKMDTRHAEVQNNRTPGYYVMLSSVLPGIYL